MARPADRKHRVRHLVKMITARPWAILPSKLDEMVELLNLRSQGHEFTDEEIRQRIEVDTGLAGLLDSVDARQQKRGSISYLRTESGVAIVPLDGVLAPRMNLAMEISGGTSTQLFTATLRAAAADDKVHAILIPVDSPGGSVLGLEEAALVIREIREQMPVVAVAVGTMASAAYVVGCAASQVVASPSSSLGSLGTVQVHYESSKAEEDAGEHYTVVTAGKYKWAANSHEKLSEEGHAILQEETDDYYGQLVGSVAASRGISGQTVIENYGQGKMLIAHRAVAAGLADRVATFETILAELDRRETGRHAAKQATNQEKHAMNPKILKAMVALDLCQQDASDEVARAALTAWYAGRAQEITDNEAQILQDLAESQAGTTVTLVATKEKTLKPVESTATRLIPVESPATHQRLLGESRIAERQRIGEIQSRGAVLQVDAAVIQEAIDKDTSLAEFLEEVTSSQARSRHPVRRIESTKSADDKFQTAAVDALLERTGLMASDWQPAAESADLRYASLLDIAGESLRIAAGHRWAGDPDTLARAALGDPEALAGLGIGAADVPHVSPGQFPNVLSALVNKSLDAIGPYQGTTFQNWAKKLSSKPDFKPSTLVRTGEFGELPYHPDGDDFEQSTLEEEYSWIQVDGYGDEFALTPKMMLDDDLDAFVSALGDKQGAHDATLNRLCCNLLTGNVAWTDGVALFHATHGNNIAAGGGGVPSETELSDIRKLFRAMTGPSNKRKLNYTIDRLLVPYSLETTTQKLLTATLQIYPTSSAGTEIFKNTVTYDVEPMLEDHSAAYWYAFADASRARAIVYCYQRGFEKMKTRNYYNPKNNCRVYQFEGRFAAAVNNCRGVCRNEGS